MQLPLFAAAAASVVGRMGQSLSAAGPVKPHTSASPFGTWWVVLASPSIAAPEAAHVFNELSPELQLQ